MCIFNDIFMFVFIVSSILVTVHFVYSLFFKSGKVKDKVKDKVKKWIKVMCDLFWGIG